MRLGLCLRLVGLMLVVLHGVERRGQQTRWVLLRVVEVDWLLLVDLAPFLLLLLLLIENLLDGLLLLLDRDLVTMHLELENTKRVHVHPLFIVELLALRLSVTAIASVVVVVVARATI